MKHKLILLFTCIICLLTIGFGQFYKYTPETLLVGNTLTFSQFNYTGKHAKLPQSIKTKNE